MSVSDLIDLNLTISIPDSTDEEVDNITRRLIRELKELDVESVQLLTNGETPEGTKAFDSVALGAVAMSLLPSVLSPLLEYLLSWTLRSPGRTIRFRGCVANQQIEFEGSFDDMQKLVTMLEEKMK